MEYTLDELKDILAELTARRSELVDKLEHNSMDSIIMDDVVKDIRRIAELRGKTATLIVHYQEEETNG